MVLNIWYLVHQKTKVLSNQKWVVTCCLKKWSCFKSGQSWLEKNRLATWDLNPWISLYLPRITGTKRLLIKRSPKSICLSTAFFKSFKILSKPSIGVFIHGFVIRGPLFKERIFTANNEGNLYGQFHIICDFSPRFRLFAVQESITESQDPKTFFFVFLIELCIKLS